MALLKGVPNVPQSVGYRNHPEPHAGVWKHGKGYWGHVPNLTETFGRYFTEQIPPVQLRYVPYRIHTPSSSISGCRKNDFPLMYSLARTKKKHKKTQKIIRRVICFQHQEQNKSSYDFFLVFQTRRTIDQAVTLFFNFRSKNKIGCFFSNFCENIYHAVTFFCVSYAQGTSTAK